MLAQQEGRLAFEVDFPAELSRREQRDFEVRPCSYVMSQMRRRRTEVSERQLSGKQLDELRAAKEKEVDNYVRNQAVEVVADKYAISPAELMKMRWVITMKEYPDGQKKVKARLCILGFQDPMLEEEAEDAGTPTPHQRTRHVFYQSCAWHRWRIHKADVVGAFLQGERLEGKP
eukprot:6705040-Alexandrium_andersonii.AAC.1